MGLRIVITPADLAWAEEAVDIAKWLFPNFCSEGVDTGFPERGRHPFTCCGVWEYRTLESLKFSSLFISPSSRLTQSLKTWPTVSLSSPHQRHKSLALSFKICGILPTRLQNPDLSWDRSLSSALLSEDDVLRLALAMEKEVYLM